jgi:hypothetical protein
MNSLVGQKGSDWFEITALQKIKHSHQQFFFLRISELEPASQD